MSETTEFQVGDWVEIVGESPELDGEVGRILTGEELRAFDIILASDEIAVDVPGDDGSPYYVLAPNLRPASAPEPTQRERLMAQWMNEREVYPPDEDGESLTYMEWLEQRYDEQAMNIAAEMVRAFDGRIFAPPSAGENLAAWINRAIGHENAAYRKLESEAESLRRLASAQGGLVRELVRQVESIAEASLTHSEKRGALKWVAADAEHRLNATESRADASGVTPVNDELPF